MTDGWVYKLRLIAGEERTAWKRYLDKYEVDWVGAQWGAKNSSSTPPDSFDLEVAYRPIYIKDGQSSKTMPTTCGSRLGGARAQGQVLRPMPWHTFRCRRRGAVRRHRDKC